MVKVQLTVMFEKQTSRLGKEPLSKEMCTLVVRIGVETMSAQ